MEFRHVLDGFRAQTTDDLLRGKSWARAHRPFMTATLATMQVPDAVVPLGGDVPRPRNGAYDVAGVGTSMAQIFASGGAGDRTNSSVSAAGAVWEAYVSTYLNMLLYGSAALAVPGASRRHIDDSFLRRFDAYKLVDGQYRILSSDLDVLVLDFEGVESQLIDAIVAHHMPSTDPTPDLDVMREISVPVLEDLLTDPVVLGQLRVVHVALKTNFNDLIQAPMLWALVYDDAHGNGNRAGAGIVVGDLRAGLGDDAEWPVEPLPERWPGISEIGDVRSAFVTVPTQKANAHTRHSMPVLRASLFSAGAFWGQSPLGPSTLRSIDRFPEHALGWPPARLTPHNHPFGRELAGSTARSTVRRAFHLG